MSRLIPALAVAVVIVVAQADLLGAPKKEKRAYKPADSRQKAAEAEPADASPPDAGSTLEQELQAAKEKRDKDLEDAAANETDRKTLDKRKQEIFSQYAAIVAALRDKYQAAHPGDPAANPPTSGKPGKAERKKNVAEEPAPEDTKASRKKGRNPEDALAAAQVKLDEENQRHQSKLQQLNAQLREAETAGNQREVRKVRKSIEKENNSYEAKKSILERKVQDLGGTAPAANVAPEK
jgi:hypothetical protein